MRFEGRARIGTGLDMTPLVDVVFLLLIFFLLTSTYIVPQAIELSLPSSTTATSIREKPVVVVIGPDRELLLDGAPLAIDEVESRLRELFAHRTERSVSIEADASVPVQDLVTIADSIRSAGGRSLALATRPPRSQP